MQAQARKDLDSTLKIVPKLAESDIDSFQRAMKLVAYQCEWSPWILDVRLPADQVPGDARRNVRDEDNNNVVVPAITAKERLDVKNAFTIITSKCEGHDVANSLEGCAMGDAPGAYRTVHEYFYRPTQAGKQAAFKMFYSMTMANTDTSINAYLALVQRRAKVVRMSGTEVGEEAVITVILNGLLPEFDRIQVLLEQERDLTLADCKSKLLDFAKKHKLDTLTRGGNATKRSKAFAVESKRGDQPATNPVAAAAPAAKQHGNNNFVRKGISYKGEPWIGGENDCQEWHRGRCRRGARCQYNHPPNPSPTKANSAQPAAPTPHCLYCGDASHFMNACPSISAEHMQHARTNFANAGTASTTKDEGKHGTVTADHVFMVSAPGPDDSAYDLDRGTSLFEAGFEALHNIGSTMQRGVAGLLGGLLHVVVAVMYLLLFAAPLLLATKGWAAVDKTVNAVSGYACKSHKPVMIILLLLACSIQTMAIQPPISGMTDSESGNRISAQLFFNKANSHSTSADVAAGKGDYEWCADSGTNRFVTNDLLDFVPGSITRSATVVAVGGGNVTSPMYGTVLVESVDNGCVVECRDVLFMPTCEKKLMPASTFVRKGSTIFIHDTDKIQLKSKDGDTIFTGRELDGLYYYRCKTVRASHLPGAPGANTTRSYLGLAVGEKISEASRDFGRRLLEAHWAYGHLHFDKLRKLLGLKKGKKGDDPDCPACTIATSRQTNLSREKYDRSTRPNHRIHIDIGFTKNYDYCFQLYVDDYTRESWLDVLDSKSDAFGAFKKLQQQRDNEHAPYKLAVVRTDGEPLYDNATWDAYCDQHGYRREFSSRHRHDQHGVAERAMQAIGVPFRCMMIQGNAPPSDIPDCLMHANVVRNNSPTKANKGWTPREKRFNKRLPVNKRLLRGPLFCLVFAHVYEQERPKHAARGIACVYLGYDDTNNAYKVKEWESGKRYYTADVTFYPNRFPYRANPRRMVDYLHQHDDYAPHVTAPLRNPANGVQSLEIDNAPPARRSSARQHGYRFSGGQAVAAIPDVDVSPAAAGNEQMARGEAANYTTYGNYFVHNFGPEPANWEEAMASKYANEWIAAKLAEQNSFAHHNVLEIVPRSNARGKKIFKPRPVLKIKVKPPSSEHPHGAIDKFKYRLTIAAFTRTLVQGVDYEEKYASTVRWNSIKILIAIAVKMNWDIVLFDIATFFLYGKMKDEVFMEQAPGWEVEGKPKEDYICKVLKSMYGLPQAPHCAQVELKETLTEGGEFHSTTADDCIYVSGQGAPTAGKDNGYAALGAHVDDLTGIGDAKGLAKIEATLGSKFKFTKEVNPTVITGVQIERDRKARWLKLHQAAYVNELLAKHNMTDCRSVDTPMDPGTARSLMLLPTSETPDPHVLKQYQSLVGAFIWLLKTRPDMMFTINLVSRFMKNATQRHLDLVSGRPLRYLKGTVDYGVVFQADDNEWRLSGASDSDLAGCLNTSRSTSGCFSKLGKYGAVMCSSSLEKKISTSTGQAETYAMQSLVKEVVWERHLLDELRFPQSEPTHLSTDNDGVLKQSTKAVNHSSAKHYRIAQAYIRSMGENGTIKVGRVDTAKNPADLFTKALHAPSFVQHREAIMGPQSPTM